MKKLKILFLSYECAPFLKKGGLGDVALGLPKALVKLGTDCRVMIPKYQAINDKKYKLKLLKKDIEVNLKNKTEYFNLYVAKLPKSKALIYFIDHKYFRLKNIFGYKNDKERFFFFCRAALETIKAVNFQANVLHCNDWQTGLAPLMLKKLFNKDKFYKKIKTVYAVHNLAYQGKVIKNVLEKFNITSSDLLNFATVNSMAQGINDADLVGTVSNTYAHEILTKEYGAGLEKVLQKRNRQGKLFGIVNGLDYEVFNPKTDKFIKQKYDLKTVKQKTANKTELQKFFDLDVDPDIPIIGIVSRLAGQKGLSLILDVIKNSFNFDYQFVLLGSGEKKYQQEFIKLAKKYPNKIGVKITFSADWAQDIYAGADLFLMPSKYEPCGLGQLIAMRYGTVPIVRATGGLKDTVVNYNKAKIKKATGFVFKKYDPAALNSAIKKAVKIYHDKKSWNRLVANCMRQDFSWEHAAKEYIEVYNKVKKL